MTPRDTRRFLKVLQGKEVELIRVLQKRDDIAIEKTADQLDQIQYATERDLAIRNVDRGFGLLRQVKAALLRIDEGRYGTCIECDSDISPKRLAAVPWAACCIQCQESVDRNSQESDGAFDSDLVSAA